MNVAISNGTIAVRNNLLGVLLFDQMKKHTQIQFQGNNSREIESRKPEQSPMQRNHVPIELQRFEIANTFICSDSLQCHRDRS